MAGLRRSWRGPFEKRAYRWLWTAMVVASVGAWGQIVGAQWLFVNDPRGAEIVSLIQTAATLPILLLVLPAGVLADALDKRWILIGVQAYVIAVSAGLALVTITGHATAPTVLLFLFALNVGGALQAPTWQPLIAEVVKADQIPSAVRQDVLAGNIGRAVGPVLAGLLISRVGPAAVFALNALTASLLLVVLLAWRRKRRRLDDREPFLMAMRAGRRFVRYDPAVVAILVRLTLYVVPGAALWVLLPLIASHQLGLDAGAYGVLYALVGLGAAAGALAPGRLRKVMTPNRIVTLGTVVFALTLAGSQLVAHVAVVGPLLVLAGATWTVVVATTNAELQVLLPAWVRARAIAALMMVFTGAQALASPVWGFLVPVVGLTGSALAASAVALVGLLGAGVFRLPDGRPLDRRPLLYWRDTPVIDMTDEPTGSVGMELEYTVLPGQEEDFFEAMEELRRSRLRTGALRWELARVLGGPTYVERVVFSSWDDHIRQMASRLTTEDKAAEDRVVSHAVGPPKVRYLLTRPRLD